MIASLACFEGGFEFVYSFVGFDLCVRISGGVGELLVADYLWVLGLVLQFGSGSLPGVWVGGGFGVVADVCVGGYGWSFCCFDCVWVVLCDWLLLYV